MINTSNEQLQALAALSQSTRQLIKQIVSTSADTEQLLAISAQVKALADQLAVQQGARPIGHFNNEIAAIDPNHTLPYSPICGYYNPVAPPVAMRFDQQTGILHGTVNCNRAYEGPKGLVHGGVISAIYDQLLALLTTCSGRPSFTAYLNIQYKKPTPLHQDLQWQAWIDHIDGRKALVKGQCLLDGELLTEAEGLFIQVKA